MLFYTLHYFLNDRDTIESEEFGIPEQVSHETAQTVLELVRYFSKQRAILNKVRGDYWLFTIIRPLPRNKTKKTVLKNEKAFTYSLRCSVCW